MDQCETCGSRNVGLIEGGRVWECGLCGGLAGDDAEIRSIMLFREAKAEGIHPAIYPLICVLNRISGLKVLASGAGDPELVVWPFVQLRAQGQDAMQSIENLTKSLALSARTRGVHWVLEVEFQAQLVFTLKPRFHRDLDRIGPEDVLTARKDLDRVRRNLERDMELSWWRR